LKRSHWRENDIEELLQNLPNIKDKRNPREIYQNIELRLHRKHRRNLVPLFAAVAALFVLTVLASSLMLGLKDSANNDASSQKSAGNSGSQREQANSSKSAEVGQNNSSLQDNKSEGKNQIADNKEDSLTAKSKKNTVQTAAPGASAGSVLASDLRNQSAITVGIPDKQVNYVIPVSYVTDKGNGGKVDEILKVMSQLDEESLGLQDYFPLDVQLASGNNGQTINLDIPENSPLLLEDELFFRVIQETFKYQNFDRVTFSSKGAKGASFSHMGFIEEIKINKRDKKAYYVYQFNENSPKMLVPSNTEFQTMDEALSEMQNISGDSTIFPSIPQEVAWDSIINKDKTAIIQLSKKTKLQNTKAYVTTLEAVLFTAKSFGYDYVRFENAGIEAIGPYNMKEDLSVPIAPNKMK
jgi:hypothetical protein